MKHLWFCLVLLPLTTALAQHNPLLPGPQQVQYGRGTLALHVEGAFRPNAFVLCKKARNLVGYGPKIRKVFA